MIFLENNTFCSKKIFSLSKSDLSHQGIITKKMTKNKDFFFIFYSGEKILVNQSDWPSPYSDFDPEFSSNYGLIFKGLEENLVGIEISGIVYPIDRDVPPLDEQKDQAEAFKQGLIKACLERDFFWGEKNFPKKYFGRQIIKLMNDLLTHGGYIEVTDFRRDYSAYRGQRRNSDRSLEKFVIKDGQLQIVSHETGNSALETIENNAIVLYSNQYCCHNNIDNISHWGIRRGAGKEVGEIDCFFNQFVFDILNELVENKGGGK